jgi:hypothetical protein
VLIRDGFAYVFAVDEAGKPANQGIDRAAHREICRDHGGLAPASRIVLSGAVFLQMSITVRVVEANHSKTTAQ